MSKHLWTRLVKGDLDMTLGFLEEDAKRLILAQWALESGFGSARAALFGHNLGNLTAGTAWKGARWTDVGGDQDADGKRITQVWRAYPSVRDFSYDYWHFLGPRANRGRYVYARSLLERAHLGDAAFQLHHAGYFTLAVETYKKRWEAALVAVEAHLKGAKNES